jgi:hypothetical protein
MRSGTCAPIHVARTSWPCLYHAPARGDMVPCASCSVAPIAYTNCTPRSSISEGHAAPPSLLRSLRVRRACMLHANQLRGIVALLMFGSGRCWKGESVKCARTLISPAQHLPFCCHPSVSPLCCPSSPFGVPFFLSLPFPGPACDAPLLLFPGVTETRSSANSRCRVPQPAPARRSQPSPLCTFEIALTE